MRLIRAALVVAFALATLAAGTASVRAADDTLGAAVTRQVFVSDSRDLAVRSMATVDVVVTFESSGGWTVEPSTMTLAPGQERAVQVVGNGEDGAGIGVTVTTSADVPDGAIRTALAFTTTISHSRPFDASALVVRALGALVALAGVVIVLRRVKPWRLRLTVAS